MFTFLYILPASDMSVENLQYLSSEQALADLAQFITFAKDKYQLPNNKWIAIGGSYSGGSVIVKHVKGSEECLLGCLLGQKHSLSIFGVILFVKLQNDPHFYFIF